VKESGCGTRLEEDIGVSHMRVLAFPCRDFVVKFINLLPFLMMAGSGKKWKRLNIRCFPKNVKKMAVIPTLGIGVRLLSL
jgi:uncharacterized SAM-binding protein YcdF (DUF218 family)